VADESGTNQAILFLDDDDRVKIFGSNCPVRGMYPYQKIAPTLNALGSQGFEVTCFKNRGLMTYFELHQTAKKWSYSMVRALDGILAQTDGYDAGTKILYGMSLSDGLDALKDIGCDAFKIQVQQEPGKPYTVTYWFKRIWKE